MKLSLINRVILLSECLWLINIIPSDLIEISKKCSSVHICRHKGKDFTDYVSHLISINSLTHMET